jgi:hypothetical protein
MTCCLDPTQSLARDSIASVPLLQEADRLGHFGITNYNAFILQNIWRVQKAGYLEQIKSLKQQMKIASQVRANQAVDVVATTNTTADARVGVADMAGNGIEVIRDDLPDSAGVNQAVVGVRLHPDAADPASGLVPAAGHTTTVNTELQTAAAAASFAPSDEIEAELSAPLTSPLVDAGAAAAAQSPL